MAIQWKQKLDMDAGKDGGKIEFSVDAGDTWENVFENPYTYNFYGFDLNNQDTLPSGDVVFSGTDNEWRDIWLCFNMSWIGYNDSITIRYTFISDETETHQEGWMIDNMMVHITNVHTIEEEKQEEYLKVYPNPTNNILHIEAKKLMEFHIIEKMELINSTGQIIDQWKYIPTKFFIDTSKYNNGLYYLKIQTNLKSETIPVVINHN
jgi:hypothetical protein